MAELRPYETKLHLRKKEAAHGPMIHICFVKLAEKVTFFFFIPQNKKISVCRIFYLLFEACEIHISVQVHFFIHV